MKKIITILFLFASIQTFAQQKVDTTKKYVLTLTENEYLALQQKLSEAAAYEAQIQKEKSDATYQEFLKKNTKEVPKKESK
jgi:predicted metal-binding transcription factor (methanogenesis marker protein 9)